MMKEFSKSQIDRLGDRLRKGEITDEDLRILDEYRESFTKAYKVVINSLRAELASEPAGRPAKSTTSIVDKLARESIRLSQIQDIAGCRLIVADIFGQETTLTKLRQVFERSTVIDRRKIPSHGYRAVHIVADVSGKLIEIQIRTQLQQLWAELCENFADAIDPAIKYGSGDPDILDMLSNASQNIAKYESLLTEIAGSTDERNATAFLDGKQVLEKLYHLLNDMKNLIDRIK